MTPPEIERPEGVASRVVSLPSWYRFERQDDTGIDKILDLVGPGRSNRCRQHTGSEEKNDRRKTHLTNGLFGGRGVPQFR